MPSLSSVKLFPSQQHTATSPLVALKSVLPENDSTFESCEVGKIGNISCINARRSCEFTHHSPACIKKATANLNMLQKQLEGWCKTVVAQKKVFLLYSMYGWTCLMPREFNVFGPLHAECPIKSVQLVS